MSVGSRPSYACHLRQGGLVTVQLVQSFKGEGSHGICNKVFGGKVSLRSFPFQALLCCVDGVLSRSRRVGVRLCACNSGVSQKVETSGAGLQRASPVGFVITLLVQAVAMSFVDDVSGTLSSTGNKVDSGTHSDQRSTFMVMPLPYIRSVHMSLLSCPRDMIPPADEVQITSSYVIREGVMGVSVHVLLVNEPTSTHD